MQATPVLLLTHDDFLWQHWRALDSRQWLPARGRELADLHRWREQGRRLAVVDAGLPRLPSWQSPEWKTLMDDMHVVIASVKPNDEQGTQAISAGAHGYCHSYAPVDTLDQVLETVSSGSVWMGRTLVSRLLRLVETRSAASPGWQPDSLTEREQVVARHAARGEPNSEIAATLGITERTVKAHLSSIFEKLGVADRLQLALLVHGISR